MLALLTLATGPAQAQELTVREIPVELPQYDRNQWHAWIDADRDCQNTRAEVLVAESVRPVTFTTARECIAARGLWIDPYTGREVVQASALDVDHLVPLANAHRSGGWEWTPERKEQYANYLDDPRHLVAISQSANRSKGDKGPEAWWPPNEGYWCEYAEAWIAVKAAWGLSATESEWWALSETLRVYCAGDD